MKFHENPSIESRVFPCGQRDRRKDMATPIVAFRNFAYEANNTEWDEILVMSVENFGSSRIWFW